MHENNTNIKRCLIRHLFGHLTINTIIKTEYTRYAEMYEGITWYIQYPQMYKSMDSRRSGIITRLSNCGV